MMKTEPVFEREVNVDIVAANLHQMLKSSADSLISFIGSSRYRAGISDISCMRESGFTEIRWYHGQIVRPKLIFSYWLGAFLVLRKYLYSKK